MFSFYAIHVYVSISVLLESGDVSAAQLVASVSGVVLGGVVEVVGSNLARGKMRKGTHPYM